MPKSVKRKNQHRQIDAHARAPDAKDSSSQSAFKSIFVMSSTDIWLSKISWKIAFVAFLTIMLVQTLVLTLGGIESHRQTHLNHLVNEARVALSASIDRSMNQTLMSPFNADEMNRLMTNDLMTGVTVYSYKYDYIANYGAYTNLVPSVQNMEESYMDPTGEVYEVVFDWSDLQSKYIVVAQIPLKDVSRSTSLYVQDQVKIMAALSLLVTFVLMIALGKWLLEPILFMRANLIAAFTNPEAPNIEPSPYGTQDEVGAAISLTQKLIQQNAENLTNLRSTAEDKIHRLAYYDSLTNLPNRALFVQTLENYARVKHDGSVQRFAIVTVDLDHFKDINDSMGHNVGDAILRSVGKKLRASLPELAIVSRTGEDEFAIMLPLSSTVLSARDVGDRVMGVIRAEPFKVFNEEFQVRASIGVSTFPDDGADADLVLKNADIALNRAKEEGRDSIKEYSEDFDRAVQERFQMLRDLRDALEHDQLQLYFQPQLCLKTGRVIGAEALLRWWMPDESKEGGRFISPAVFIPVAEQSGLILPIGQWVLKEAGNMAMRLHQEHDIHIRMAVNVSGMQFANGNICEDVSTVLSETGIAPNMLELEVTESVFMEDIDKTVGVLNNLHALGVELAIDDFGTGYSSLSYLSQFPIDRLKIDQSFIRQALNHTENASIARTIINLGHSLNLKVIAEGVETKAHQDFLKSEGCDEVQGYRYSRPIPADDLVAFVTNYNNDLDSFPD